MRKASRTSWLQRLGFETVQNRLQLCPQERDIASDEITDDVVIDVEVGVGEDDSYADDLTPCDLGMSVFEIVRDMRRSLAEHFNPTLSCPLDDWTWLQGVRGRQRE